MEGLASEGFGCRRPKSLVNDRHLVNARVSALFYALSGRDDGVIAGTESLTRSATPIGAGTVFNTFGATIQLLTLLSLSRHNLVTDLIGGRVHSVQELCEAQVLRGIAAIDCGCGPLPTFARVSRAMGARIWTVDLLESSNFHDTCGARDPHELEHHLVGDFGSYSVWDKLGRMVPLTVHLVSHSHTEIATGLPRALVTMDEWGAETFDSPTALVSAVDVEAHHLFPVLHRDGCYLKVEGHEARLRRRAELS